MDTAVNQLIDQVNSSERQSKYKRNMLLKVEEDIQRTQLDLNSWKEKGSELCLQYQQKLEEMSSKEADFKISILKEDILKNMLIHKELSLQKVEAELDEIQGKVWYEREKFCEKVQKYTKLHGVLTFFRHVDDSIETPDRNIKSLTGEDGEQEDLSILEEEVLILEVQLVAEGQLEETTRVHHHTAEQEREQLLMEPVSGSEFMQLQEKLRLSKEETKHLEGECEVMQAEVKRLNFLLQQPFWSLHSTHTDQLKHNAMIYRDQFHKSTMILPSLSENQSNLSTMISRNLSTNQTKQNTLILQSTTNLQNLTIEKSWQSSSMPLDPLQQSSTVYRHISMDRSEQDMSTHPNLSMDGSDQDMPTINLSMDSSNQNGMIYSNLSMNQLNQNTSAYQRQPMGGTLRSSSDSSTIDQFKMGAAPHKKQPINQFQERSMSAEKQTASQSNWHTSTHKDLFLDQPKTIVHKSWLVEESSLAGNVMQSRQQNTLAHWLQSTKGSLDENREAMSIVLTDRPSLLPDYDQKCKPLKKAFMPRKPSGITLPVNKKLILPASSKM